MFNRYTLFVQLVAFYPNSDHLKGGDGDGIYRVNISDEKLEPKWSNPWDEKVEILLHTITGRGLLFLPFYFNFTAIGIALHGIPNGAAGEFELAASASSLKHKTNTPQMTLNGNTSKWYDTVILQCHLVTKFPDGANTIYGTIYRLPKWCDSLFSPATPIYQCKHHGHPLVNGFQLPFVIRTTSWT